MPILQAVDFKSIAYTSFATRASRFSVWASERLQKDRNFGSLTVWY